MKKIKVLDSVLREGTQCKGISFSVQDKINIAKALDELGIDYIEAGNPFSNPTELEFFEKMAQVPLQHAKLTAFGSTRRRDTKAEEDPGLKALLSVNTPVVTVFGKSSVFHVEKVLGTTLEENLAMIRDTVAYLKKCKKEVIYDAEHFFDGYKLDRSYAIATIQEAKKAGADSIVLCDTNGGTLPVEMRDIVADVVKQVPGEIGIHTHNDSGLATALAIIAVEAGATHIQGTVIGVGERCGNANLCELLPTLELKMGCELIGKERLQKLTPMTAKIAETCNITLREDMPYVGKNAFAHKAGMHIDAVYKSAKSFEHIRPEDVGNERQFLISQVGGRSAAMQKIEGVLGHYEKGSKEIVELTRVLKEYEHNGYQFELAEASFELLARRTFGLDTPFFAVSQFKIMEDQNDEKEDPTTAALIKVKVGEKEEITAAEGIGPVHALDNALRKALEIFYPCLKGVRLTDYKVRVIDSRSATGARVRVLIESSDGEEYWNTIGVSEDILNASFHALMDSVEYKLLKESRKNGKRLAPNQ